MLNWLGTLLQIAGAIALAGRWLDPYWAYAIMTPGACLLAWRNAVIREWPQFWLMIVFIGINLYGIWNWGAGA